jgi:hypothetical protein
MNCWLRLGRRTAHYSERPPREMVLPILQNIVGATDTVCSLAHGGKRLEVIE